VTAAGRWLETNVPVGKEILVTSEEMEVLARFHWPNRKFRLYPHERGAVTTDEIPGVVNGMPFDDSGRAIFIFGRAWLSDPDGKLQDALAERYQSCTGITVPGIRIHCYEPGPRAMGNVKR
jgi:hypothetical protein